MSTNAGRNSKFQHSRQRDIYMLTLKQGSVDVSDLATRFNVTTETIRRDLSDLQERGASTAARCRSSS
jgi:DeoR/GlpR family transcriptional regulator of sugar metabolism